MHTKKMSLFDIKWTHEKTNPLCTYKNLCYTDDARYLEHFGFKDCLQVNEREALFYYRPSTDYNSYDTWNYIPAPNSIVEIYNNLNMKWYKDENNT